MRRYLLDVNTVLALIDSQHAQHDAAMAWAARREDARWLTCPIVQNGVVRIAGQPAYSQHAGTRADLYAALQEFCAQPRHEFCADGVSLLDTAHVTRPDLLTSKAVTDVYLLALARHHGARLATFDHRIASGAVPGGVHAIEPVDA